MASIGIVKTIALVKKAMIYVGIAIIKTFLIKLFFIKNILP